MVSDSAYFDSLGRGGVLSGGISEVLSLEWSDTMLRSKKACTSL